MEAMPPAVVITSEFSTILFKQLLAGRIDAANPKSGQAKTLGKAEDRHDSFTPLVSKGIDAPVGLLRKYDVRPDLIVHNIEIIFLAQSHDVLQILRAVQDAEGVVRVAQADHAGLGRNVVFQICKIDIAVFQLRREIE